MRSFDTLSIEKSGVVWCAKACLLIHARASSSYPYWLRSRAMSGAEHEMSMMGVILANRRANQEEGRRGWARDWCDGS